ncbi:MAG: ArsC/Spx/MgsR family protein [Sideroxyarcus sp.]
MMSTILFYEKPGCSNNTKQKVWLAASGHTVLAKNLLTEKWTAERLRPFFANLPVAQWFNPAAPRVKSGEVDPAAIDAEMAISMMLLDPLLIRRPLMEVDGKLRVGFDAEAVDAWIGLNDAKPGGQNRPPLLNPLPQAGEEANESLRDFDFTGDLESCPKSHNANPCPSPEEHHHA